MEEDYRFNSSEKNFVRSRWVEFTKKSYKNDHEFKYMCMPSVEMQDLRLYAEEGLLEIKDAETSEVKKLMKGEVLAFEQDTKKTREMRNKLVNLKVVNSSVSGTVISRNEEKEFPFDTINLDFDGSLEKSMNDPGRFFDNLFYQQSNGGHDCSLFVTFPETVKDYTPQYTEKLREIITLNIADPNCREFKDEYNKRFGIPDASLNDENLSIVAITKLVIRFAIFYKFRMAEAEYYTYGSRESSKGGRQRMIALLYYFTYSGRLNQTSSYCEDVMYSLNLAKDLTNQSNESK